MEQADVRRILYDSGIRYTETSSFPQPCRYALLAKENRITVLDRSGVRIRHGFWIVYTDDNIMVLGKYNLVELQAMHQLGDEIAEEFFRMDASARDGIVYELECLLSSLDVRHVVIMEEEKRLLGFSLSVFLHEKATVADFFDGYYRIKELRRLAEARASGLIRGHA